MEFGEAWQSSSIWPTGQPSQFSRHICICSDDVIQLQWIYFALEDDVHFPTAKNFDQNADNSQHNGTSSDEIIIKRTRT